MRAEEMLKDIVEDRRSGSSKIMKKTMDLLEMVEKERRAEVMDMIVKAHPSMSGLSALMKTVVTGEKSVGEIRQEIEDSNRMTIENLKGLVEGKSVVAMSRSHITEQGLVTASKVNVLLSHPGGEGKDTAQYLRGKGIVVNTVHDAEMGYAVRDCDVVVVGADSLLPDGFVNKVGTLPLALTAKHFGKPFYVASPSYKAARESTIRPPFEFIPQDLVTSLVEEKGVKKLENLFKEL
ncbi:MAG: hypothetical protein ACOC5L_02840 [Halobacteriota archaeon]